MKVSINITIELDIPEGATHYTGNLMSKPLLHKTVKLGTKARWYYWDRHIGVWSLCAVPERPLPIPFTTLSGG